MPELPRNNFAGQVSTRLGRVSLNPRGEYAEGETYDRLDIVQYNGSGWICLKDSTTGVTPVEGENWMRFADNGGAATVEAAQQYAEQAKASQTAAGESATAAEQSATDAETAKTGAETALASAETAKEDAASSATEAAGSATEAAESAQTAKDYSGKPPVIGEDENWETWDAELGEYVTTGKPSRGAKGDKGDKGDPGKDGTGTGDMLASVYDPQSKATDVFQYVDDAVASAVPSGEFLPVNNPVFTGALKSESGRVRIKEIVNDPMWQFYEGYIEFRNIDNMSPATIGIPYDSFEISIDGGGSGIHKVEFSYLGLGAEPENNRLFLKNLEAPKDIYDAANKKYVDDAVATKQDKLTGQQGQVVGFDEEGNAVAQENKSSLSPVSAKIAQPPTKTEYIAGEEFDGAGMILEVVCEDGTHFATGDFTVDPSGPLEVGTEHVTVKYTYGGKSLEATQTISVKRGVDVFGVCWDTTNPNTALTRLKVADDPNHLVTTDIEGEPSPAVGTEGGSSPFDAFLPWSGMEEYNVMSGGTLVKTGESSFTRSNDTVVYIPEFGYKAVFYGSKVYYYISSKPTEDCPKHPGSGKYVAKYVTGASNVSKSSMAPLVSQTRATFRSGAQSKGNGWSQWGFDTWCAITALYLVEWADWDSQTKIGKGYAFGNSAAINTGTTDAMKYHTGRASGEDGKTQVMYRWIEGLWGNVRQWVDGYNANGTTPYVCLDPAKYKDDSNTDGYSELGVTLPASGWTKNLGESKSFNLAYCPNTSGGSDSTYIPDYVYSSTGWHVLNVGGSWSYASYAGLFCFVVDDSAAIAGTAIGSRLLFNP